METGIVPPDWNHRIDRGELDELLHLVRPGPDKTRWDKAIEHTSRGDFENLRLILGTGLDIEGLFPVAWWEEVIDGLGDAWRCPKAINRYMDHGNEEVTPHTTLMHLAAKCNQVQVLKLLLEHGATIGCVSIPNAHRINSTPLSDAVLASQLEAFKFLLEAGASIHYTMHDDIGEITFSEDLLVRSVHQSSTNPESAFTCSTAEIVRCLFQQGIDVIFQPGLPCRFMRMAVETARPEVVRVLLERGARCNNTLEAFVDSNGGEQLLDLILTNGAGGDSLSPIFGCMGRPKSDKDRLRINRARA